MNEAGSRRFAGNVMGMVRRRQYVLAFLLYLCMNAIVIRLAGFPFQRALLFAFGSTFPPFVFGIPVVRYYSSRRVSFSGAGAAIQVALGFAFGLLSTTGTGVIFYVIERERFTFRLENYVWGFLIALFVFTILASVSHALRVQSDLTLERERAAAAETSRAKAELAALRARIDPHFLFNTLHSLLALVRQDPGRAEEAIEQFGDLLRYTFSASDGEVRTLRQEWELVDNYLALERLRLGARLRVDAKLEDNAASVPLPVLTLQPLVENAVRYAVANRGAGGRISIRAVRHDSSVRITVSDDGPGNETPKLTPGRGLDLVRQRLAYMYGDRARMDLARSAEGGVCVTISVDA